MKNHEAVCHRCFEADGGGPYLCASSERTACRHHGWLASSTTAGRHQYLITLAIECDGVAWEATHTTATVTSVN